MSTQARSELRRLRVALPYAGALWPILALALVLLASSTDKIATTYTPDDAYFYLVVARNAARGILSSFSGIDPTNGYHPLWMWFLVPVFWLVRDADSALRAVCLVQMALYAAGAVLIMQLLPSERSAERALVGALFAFLTALASWYGLEAGLATLLFLVALRLAMAEVAGRSSLGRSLALGIVSGLTVLARLDAALLVGPALLYVAWAQHRAGIAIERTLAPALVGALCVAPYLASNWLAYGHLMPISGAIKSSFPELNPVNYPLISRRWARLAVPLVVALSAQIVAHRNVTGLPAERRRVVNLGTAVVLGLSLFYCYELLFQRDAAWALFSWHFSVATAAACALLANALTLVSRPMLVRAAYAGVAAATLGMLVIRFAPHRRGDGGMIDVLDAARWVARHSTRRTVIGTTDSGIIAYFGGQPTINLDGLINNFEYQKVLEAGTLRAYLDDRHVERVIVTGRGFYNWTGGCFCGPMELHNRARSMLCFDEDDLLYRTPGPPHRPKQGRTAIFRWPPAHLATPHSRPAPTVAACAKRIGS
jgi:hypothetical protein